MSFDYDLNFTGCKATTHNLSNGPVDELAIVVYDRQDGSDPRIDFDANPAHYTPEEVAVHQQRFIALLHQLVSPELPLHAFRLLLPDELNTVITRIQCNCARGWRIHSAATVRSQVARTPDLTSIVFGECSLTYAELNASCQPAGPSSRRHEHWAGIAGWNLLAAFAGDACRFAGRVENGSRLRTARSGISAGASCRMLARCSSCLRTHHVSALFTSAAEHKSACARFRRRKPSPGSGT